MGPSLLTSFLRCSMLSDSGLSEAKRAARSMGGRRQQLARAEPDQYVHLASKLDGYYEGPVTSRQKLTLAL